MRHARSDYEAIQPWPTKRPHHVKQNGVLAMDVPPEMTGYPIIPDDEPVFILRAKDITAPAIVRLWCQAQEDIGGDPVVAERIQRWADEMESYGREHGAKVPDTPHEFLAP